MLTPTSSPACCTACSYRGRCSNPDCGCHRLAAAPPDLEAAAYQLERARAVGAGAFSFARLSFLATVREAVDAAAPESTS